MGRTIEKVAEGAKNADGVSLEDIKVGQKLKIETAHTEYVLERREDGFYLSGNEKYCPTPRKVIISGSNFGGSSIMPGFLGIGMHMEFGIIEGHDKIVTSKIEDIETLE